ncbi:MAG: hypothetical protein K9W44_00055 [Candidatus Lokiarchaeota archaeon]|nr:hypothetical protein [Candidatus Harpocratesius repetitus]
MRSSLVVKSKFEHICNAQYIPMSDGTQIQVLTTKLKDLSDNSQQSATIPHYTLMLIPGWGTIVPSWDSFLMEAVNLFNIVYFESREKDSSILGKHIHSNMDRLAQDIEETIKFLKIPSNQLILVGSCIGANTIAYGLMNNRFSPKLTIFIGPQLHFPLPWYARFLIPISPHWLFRFFRPILRFWVKYFQTADKDQAQKYIRIINEADSKKWKKVGKAIAFEQFDSIYPQITQTVHVIGEGNDKMHKASDALKIAQLLKNAVFVMMDSNAATHSGEMAQKIHNLILQEQSARINEDF